MQIFSVLSALHFWNSLLHDSTAGKEIQQKKGKKPFRARLNSTALQDNPLYNISEEERVLCSRWEKWHPQQEAELADPFAVLVFGYCLDRAVSGPTAGIKVRSKG